LTEKAFAFRSCIAARSESANRNASSFACIRSHGVFARLSSSSETFISLSGVPPQASAVSCTAKASIDFSALDSFSLAFIMERLSHPAGRCKLP